MTITLQPNNYLAPIGRRYAERSAGRRRRAEPRQHLPNVRSGQLAYRAITGKLDYGLRYDFFTIKSTEFAQGFGGFSPRLKLTRSLGQPRERLRVCRPLLRAVLAREREPGSAAYLLNLPLQPTIAQFDLKPERDTQLEFGGHVPVGSGDLGFRVWQKNANDLIDDTQVGVTLLHQDINYTLGRLVAGGAQLPASAGAQRARLFFGGARRFRSTAAAKRSCSRRASGQPTGFTPADHEQNWTHGRRSSAQQRRGGWFSADGEYGSGLSSALNPAADHVCRPRSRRTDRRPL